MKRKLVSLILIILISLAGGIYLYLDNYKIAFENMIVAESDILVYVESESSLFYRIEKALLEREDEKGREKALKNYRIINNNLERLFILGLSSYGLDYRPLEQQNIALVLDFGRKAPLLRMRIGKYFTRESGFFKLKDKYKDDLIESNILKSNQDLYMNIYRGYYIFTLNPTTLGLYEKELREGRVNENFVANLDRKSMYMIDFRKFLGEKILTGENNINYLIGYLDYEDESFIFNNKLTFDNNEISSYFEPERQKRLGYYLESDSRGIYISNNSLSELAFLIFVYRFASEDIAMDIGGFNWSSVIDKIGTEAYIDLEGRSGVIALRESDFFKFIFSMFLERTADNAYRINDEYKLYIEDNLLFVNKLLERRDVSSLKGEDVLKLKLSIDYIMSIFAMEGICSDKSYIKVEVKNKDKDIELNIEIKDCFYSDFFEAIRNR